MPRTRSSSDEAADKATTTTPSGGPAKSGGTKSKVSKSSSKEPAESAKPAEAGGPVSAEGKRAKTKGGAFAKAEPPTSAAGATDEQHVADEPDSQSPVTPNSETRAATSTSEPKPSEPPADSEQVATPPAAADEPPPDHIDGIALPASHGKAAIFGGPKDRSAKPDDKLGLPTGLHFQYERIRSLNPKSFYCAMRWDYRQHHMSTEEGKRWWANKKVLVTNPVTGAAVVLKAVDHGPHESTGFVIGISPGAAEALGIDAGQEVDIKFADQKAPVGKVTDQGPA